MRFEYKKFYSTDYKNLYNFFFNRNFLKKYVLSYQANIYRYTKLRILNIIFFQGFIKFEKHTYVFNVLFCQ